jgi:hypothetical protein
MRVDFPEPDGPIMATKSPGKIFKSIPCRTCVTTSPFAYSFVMPLI